MKNYPGGHQGSPNGFCLMNPVGPNILGRPEPTQPEPNSGGTFMHQLGINLILQDRFKGLNTKTRGSSKCQYLNLGI